MRVFTNPHLNDPFRWHGRRIGLLGGSFNPVHDGHLHIAELAQKKLDLDFVWWIVTPQNPLKAGHGMAPYDERFAAVEARIAGHPRQLPTHIERDLGTRYTFETVQGVKERFPSTQFLWICGMDNAHIFHRWDRWRDLTCLLPVVFIARPPAHSLVRMSKLRLNRFPPHKILTGGFTKTALNPGIYWLMGTKMLDISSTQIRKSGK